jgi:hypothetical protein
VEKKNNGSPGLERQVSVRMDTYKKTGVLLLQKNKKQVNLSTRNIKSL